MLFIFCSFGDSAKYEELRAQEGYRLLLYLDEAGTTNYAFLAS
jgi:hypothetical protein